MSTKFPPTDAATYIRGLKLEKSKVAAFAHFRATYGEAYANKLRSLLGKQNACTTMQTNLTSKLDQ